MSKSNELVPLSELLIDNEADYSNLKTIGFYDIFPNYVPIENIGVDVNRTRELCNLGGIWKVKVTGVTGGDTSKVEHDISGYSSDGSAYSEGKKKTHITPPHKSGIRPYRFNMGYQPFSNTWGELTTELNLDEINQRILSDKNSGGLRSADVWSDLLNKSITESIRNSGCRHLLLGSNKSQLTEAAVVYTFDLIVTYGLSLFACYSGSLISCSAEQFRVDSLMASCIPLTYSKMRGMLFKRKMGRLNAFIRTFGDGIDPKLYESRSSLFNGPQFDRALILYLTASRSKLIQPIP